MPALRVPRLRTPPPLALFAALCAVAAALAGALRRDGWGLRDGGPASASAARALGGGGARTRFRRRRVAVFCGGGGEAGEGAEGAEGGAVFAPLVRLAAALTAGGHAVAAVGCGNASGAVPHAAPMGFPTDAPAATRAAYGAHLFLAGDGARGHGAFDAAHFPAAAGAAFFATRGAPPLPVVVHAAAPPAAWARAAARAPPRSKAAVEAAFLEAAAVRAAHAVALPDAAALARPRWTAGGSVLVAPPLAGPRLTHPATPPGTAHRPELVFPPPAAVRTLRAVLAALHALAARGRAAPATLFLAAPARSYPGLVRRAAALPGVTLLHDPAADPAAYAAADTARVLVVPCDVAPGTTWALDAAAAGARLAACGRDGLREALAAMDPAGAGARTFEPKDDLAAVLERCLSGAAEPPPPRSNAPAPADPADAWVDWHSRLPDAAARAVAPPTFLPLVSVIMTTHNRDRYLTDAVRSLLAQDYPNVELILVDDASDSPDALAEIARAEALMARRRGWRVLRLPANRYLGEARNEGRRLARGRLLMFMDDDNLALPHEISAFWSTMYRTGAHACSSLVSSFYSDKPPTDDEVRTGPKPFRWLPVGGAAGIGAFTNRFGDANFFVRADVFDALGGFSADRLPFEDWQFLGSLVLAGYRLEVVPEPLFWKRELRESMMHAMDRRENLRGTLRALSPYMGLERGAGLPAVVARLEGDDRSLGFRDLFADSRAQFSAVQGLHQWDYGYRRGRSGDFTPFCAACYGTGPDAGFCGPLAGQASVRVLDRGSQVGARTGDSSVLVVRRWTSDEVGNATMRAEFRKDPACPSRTALRILVGGAVAADVALQADGTRRSLDVPVLLAVGLAVECQVEAAEPGGCHRVEVDIRIGTAEEEPA
ncbi:hypothetical protein DFJ74DRAFT_729573 [Hyaloraphidium curvatum]|nr:hypothetical protein DFJ74DRAFT_729573 [Hyaloraphidium curvatum]